MAVKVQRVLTVVGILTLISSAAFAEEGSTITTPNSSSSPPFPYGSYPDSSGTSAADEGCPPCMIGQGGQCFNTNSGPETLSTPVLSVLSRNSSDYDVMMAIREALPTFASLPGFQGDNPCTWMPDESSDFISCEDINGEVRVIGLTFGGIFGVADNLDLNVTFPLDLVAGLDALTGISITDSGPNGFTGELPETWAGAFDYVTSISLSNNSFSGSIPESWAAEGAFPALKSLDLGSNKLSGALPHWSNASIPNLASLALADNAFTGTLPQFWVASNHLTGKLPESYGSPESFGQLAYFNLSRNSFTGALPESWGGSLAFRRSSPDTNYTAVSLTLTLNENPGLSGSIPAAWNKSGLMTYGQIMTIYVAPGTALCGSPPSYVIALALDPSSSLYDSEGGFNRAALPECTATKKP